MGAATLGGGPLGAADRAGRRRLQHAAGRGLHSLTSELNLRTFRKTSLPLELNLSTSGPHPRINLGYVGNKVSLS
jgi:hypothetical protein